jgi:hypothetical protein
MLYHERADLNNLNEEDREQHLFDNFNRSAALSNSDDSEDINRAWENITDNIKTTT